jgi:hypothetical protein
MISGFTYDAHPIVVCFMYLSLAHTAALPDFCCDVE